MTISSEGNILSWANRHSLHTSEIQTLYTLNRLTHKNFVRNEIT